MSWRQPPSGSIARDKISAQRAWAVWAPHLRTFSKKYGSFIMVVLALSKDLSPRSSSLHDKLCPEDQWQLFLATGAAHCQEVLWISNWCMLCRFNSKLTTCVVFTITQSISCLPACDQLPLLLLLSSRNPWIYYLVLIGRCKKVKACKKDKALEYINYIFSRVISFLQVYLFAGLSVFAGLSYFCVALLQVFICGVHALSFFEGLTWSPQKG